MFNQLQIGLEEAKATTQIKKRRSMVSTPKVGKKASREDITETLLPYLFPNDYLSEVCAGIDHAGGRAFVNWDYQNEVPDIQFLLLQDCKETLEKDMPNVDAMIEVLDWMLRANQHDHDFTFAKCSESVGMPYEMGKSVFSIKVEQALWKAKKHRNKKSARLVRILTKALTMF